MSGRMSSNQQLAVGDSREPTGRRHGRGGAAPAHGGSSEGPDPTVVLKARWASRSFLLAQQTTTSGFQPFRLSSS